MLHQLNDMMALGKENAKMSIGNKIKQRREQLGMSQDELAKKLGYSSRSTVNKIEKGINDITQSKIIAFANALHVTPAYLMDWESNVIEEDKDLINNVLSLGDRFSDSVENMSNKELALKEFLNGIGYDLLKVKDTYHFISNRGSGQITEEKVNEMIKMIESILEPTAFKLNIELSKDSRSKIEV